MISGLITHPDKVLFPERGETKADLALRNLEHLRLEHYAMLRIKEGAHFAVDSVTLTAEAQHTIDAFLAQVRTVERQHRKSA